MGLSKGLFLKSISCDGERCGKRTESFWRLASLFRSAKEEGWMKEGEQWRCHDCNMDKVHPTRAKRKEAASAVRSQSTAKG